MHFGYDHKGIQWDPWTSVNLASPLTLRWLLKTLNASMSSDGFVHSGQHLGLCERGPAPFAEKAPNENKKRFSVLIDYTIKHNNPYYITFLPLNHTQCTFDLNSTTSVITRVTLRNPVAIRIITWGRWCERCILRVCLFAICANISKLG